jgi:hypothetical protein
MIGRGGPPAFTDRGKVMEIGDSRRRDAVLAALQLCAQKWRTFTLHGAVHRMCCKGPSLGH